jgi:hypothetical protein
MHRMLSQRNCRTDASKLGSASPQTTFLRRGQISLLKRFDDILHVYPLMGGYALQNNGCQPPFDVGMQRDGHSLKPGI